jgi:hypothetical protein
LSERRFINSYREGGFATSSCGFNGKPETPNRMYTANISAIDKGIASRNGTCSYAGKTCERIAK